MNEPIHAVDINSPAYGGVGLGRLPDGRAVFVPFTLPGERVTVRLIEEKRGFARAELLEVLSPSPNRITPRCRHFQVCGGCHYQHTPYANQLKLKRQVVVEQLERIAGIDHPPVCEVVPSPVEWNYRNTVQFHLSPTGKLGYQAARSHEVIEIQECFLPEDVVDQTWPRLDMEALPGVKRLSLRGGVNDDVLLVLEGDSPEIPELELDLPISVVHLMKEHCVVLAGSNHIFVEVLGRLFRVSAGSFFQVNMKMAEKMVQHVLDILPLKTPDILVDLYSGVGLFSAFLAPKVSRCIGVELSPSACEDYAVNLEEFDHVELYQGAVEDILPALSIKSDVMIIDPPRTGLDRVVRDVILKMGPDRVVYVSCDPATLSRDLRSFLAGGYHLVQATPFDLFPQTFHIETICLLEKMDQQV